MTTHQHKAFDMNELVEYKDLESAWEVARIIGKNADGTYHIQFTYDDVILADVPAEFLRKRPWS